MAGNMHKWASRHRKTEKSGHREAAKTIPYPRRRCCGMISENQEAIWGMSVKLTRLRVDGIIHLKRYKVPGKHLDS